MNMVELLNLISVTDTNDDTKLGDIMKNHYEKFKLLHEVLSGIDASLMNNVKQCQCLTGEFKLSIEAIIDKKHMKNFENALVDELEECESPRLEEFSIDYHKDTRLDIMIIEVTSIYLVREDEEIYEY